MDALPLTPQQKLVALLRSDPQTSEEEHFKLVLVMTEMERVKYIVRSYVRARLAKVSVRWLRPCTSGMAYAGACAARRDCPCPLPTDR
jgi:hypothetical protein